MRTDIALTALLIIILINGCVQEQEIEPESKISSPIDLGLSISSFVTKYECTISDQYDQNSDDIVSQTDVELCQPCFNKESPLGDCSKCDFDGDCVVDIYDVLIHSGKSTPVYIWRYYDKCWDYDCTSEFPPYPKLTESQRPSNIIVDKTNFIQATGNVDIIVVFLYAYDPLPNEYVSILKADNDVRSFNYVSQWFKEKANNYGLNLNINIKFSDQQHKVPEEYIIHNLQESGSKHLYNYIIENLSQYSNYEIIVPFYYGSYDFSFYNHQSRPNSFTLFSKQSSPGLFYPNFGENTTHYSKSFAHELSHVFGASDKYTCLVPNSLSCTYAKENGIGCWIESDEPTELGRDIMCHRVPEFDDNEWAFYNPALNELLVIEVTAKEFGWYDADTDGILEVNDPCPFLKENNCYVPTTTIPVCTISDQYDQNSDKIVNRRDIEMCKSCFNKESPLGDCSKCDFNGDCVVDIYDVLIHSGHFDFVTLLKSDYFSSDEIALSIARGDVNNYTFSDLYEGIDHPVNVDPNKFQYKILNAMRMLGYSLSATQDKPLLVRWAEAFQLKHNLPLSDIITSDFIIKLDEKIHTHENQIIVYTSLFPIDEDYTIDGITVEYVPHHENEPSKDHVRFFFSFLMSSLPKKIAPLTINSVHEFFIHNAHETVYYDSGWKLNYIPTASPLNKTAKGIYKSVKLDFSDSKNVYVFFHEYGHQIDELLYSHLSPHAGMINTTDFYEIIFDMDDCNIHVWKTCKPKSNARFVSDYALSWENPDDPGHYSIAEAFAESFAMYVLQGKLYRKLATIDTSYQLQYDWLKENVFEGVEYCTGDESLITWGSPFWDYYDNQLPSRVGSITNDAFVPSQTDDDNPIFSLFDLINKCTPRVLTVTSTFKTIYDEPTETIFNVSLPSEIELDNGTIQWDGILPEGKFSEKTFTTTINVKEYGKFIIPVTAVHAYRTDGIITSWMGDIDYVCIESTPKEINAVTSDQGCFLQTPEGPQQEAAPYGK